MKLNKKDLALLYTSKNHLTNRKSRKRTKVCLVRCFLTYVCLSRSVLLLLTVIFVVVYSLPSCRFIYIFVVAFYAHLRQHHIVYTWKKEMLKRNTFSMPKIDNSCISCLHFKINAGQVYSVVDTVCYALLWTYNGAIRHRFREKAGEIYYIHFVMSLEDVGAQANRLRNY